MSRRDFLLTVDVEALPARASRDRVPRLIWGDFGDGARAGVGEMAAVAGDAGVPVTFFVDMVETRLYGDEIRQCARRLHESGHDVELHLHPEILPKSYWLETFGAVPEIRTQEYFDEAMAGTVFGEFARELSDATGQERITAYRAGSFRIGRSMLAAQHRLGIPLSSNLSYESFLNQGRFPLAPPDAGPFRWSEGPVEIPITQIRPNGAWKVLSFPMVLKGTSFERVFAELAAEERDDPVVMILHSWSLLRRRAGSREFSGTSPERLAHLREIVRAAAGAFDCIDFRTLRERIETGQLPVGRTRKFLDHLNKSRHLYGEAGSARTPVPAAAPRKRLAPRAKAGNGTGDPARERLQAEVARLRREQAKLRRNRERLEGKLDGLEGSVSYRLGHALVLCFHAPRRLLALPRDLARLYLEAKGPKPAAPARKDLG